MTLQIWLIIVHMELVTTFLCVGAQDVRYGYIHKEVSSGDQALLDCEREYYSKSIGKIVSVDWFKLDNKSLETVYLYVWHPRSAEWQINNKVEDRLDFIRHLVLRINTTVAEDSGVYKCSILDDKPFTALFELHVAKVYTTNLHDETVSATMSPAKPYVTQRTIEYERINILKVNDSVAKYEFEITGPVKGLCVTTKNTIKISEVVAGSNVKIHSCLEGELQIMSQHIIPAECYTECSARIHDDILIADSVNKRLLVIDHDGQIIAKIPLPFKPWYITSVGETVWINSRGTIDTNMHVYKVKFDKEYQVLETEKNVLDCPYSDAYNIGANGRRLAVAHTFSNTVCVHDCSGNLLYVYGKRKGQLNHPHDVCLDNADNLHIADHDNDRIVIVNASGALDNVIHVRDRPNRLTMYRSKLFVECRGQYVYEYNTESDNMASIGNNSNQKDFEVHGTMM